MSKAIRIIAGLGNPEDKYERTLHNAGFWFVDALARKYGGNFRYDKKFDADSCRINPHGAEVWLVKPQSYMNNSGQPVRGLLDYYRLGVDELLVAHDEIDLPPGTTRLKEGGGKVSHLITEVEVVCLPRYLPEYLDIDVSELELDAMLKLSDIVLPEGVSIPALAQGEEADRSVVSIHVIKEVIIEDEEEIEPGAVPVEGEEAPAEEAAGDDAADETEDD